MNQEKLVKQSSVQLFKKYVFSPFQNREFTNNQDQLEYIAQEIYNWARSNGAEYVSFFAHPMRHQTLQKHMSFLSLKFIKENLLQSIGSEKMSFSQIWKEQFDGSSLPNGNLRSANQSRANLIWDHLSELFIRKRNRVLYIPSFIITTEGHPLDDRVNFRKAEKMFTQEISKLLHRFQIQHQDVFLSVSLEQQFFIVPKEFAERRLDLKYTDRLLIGKKSFSMPAKYNYLKKIPSQVQKALKEAEIQLLELGVPIKVRHCEGGTNQFEFESQIQNAAAAIDHNVLKMKILQESCQRNGLYAIFHEKPFANLNGSGKHINWSITYLDNNDKVKNLYDLQSEDKQLLIFLILVTLKAIQDNHKLLIASTMNVGNQVRLGENEAPLPAMSVYLGKVASNLIEGLQLPEQSNFREKFDFLLKNEFLEVGDRNRTSTIAYSENRFEFRLPGSSQNCTFPITIIMASITNEIRNLLKKMDSGLTINQIISEYREQSRNVRYEGNCYSEEWKKDAEQRGLYNSKDTIIERISNIESESKILIDTGIYIKSQIEAKHQVMKEDYLDTVKIERECLLKMINTDIIPRSYSFISTFPRELHLKNIENRMKKFDKLLEELIGRTQELEKSQFIEEDFANAYKIRQDIFKLSDLVDKVLDMLPQTESFPELNRYLNKWEAF